MTSKITISEELVTPKMADQILQRHHQRVAAGLFRQRAISPAQVNKYAADMTSGSWLLNPEPLTFDTNDDLINGQHRLEAVRQANVPVPFFISRGWDPATEGKLSTIDVIDGGRARTVANQMMMHGVPNASNILSSLNAIVTIVNGAHKVPISYPTARFLLDKANLDESIQAIMRCIYSSRDSAGRIIGPIAYYHTVKPRKAIEFANNLFRMEWGSGSPVQYFALWRKRTTHRDVEVTMGALLSCLKAFDEGRTVEKIYPLSAEVWDWALALNPALNKTILSVASHSSINRKLRRVRMTVTAPKA